MTMKRTRNGLSPTVGSLLTKSDDDFVGCCDGITFGVDRGVPFHTGGPNWTPEQQVAWGRANAKFFQSVTDRLARYAEAVESQPRTERITPK